jgi:hypothetical protein
VVGAACVAGCEGIDDSGINGNQAPGCNDFLYFDYALESATWDATTSTLETVGIFAPSEDASACSSLPMAEVVHRTVLPPTRLISAVNRVTPISREEYQARFDQLIAITGFADYPIVVPGLGEFQTQIWGMSVCHSKSVEPFRLYPRHDLAPDGVNLGLGGCDLTTCGDGICDDDEDVASCPGDCGCWNGIRESGEACDSADLGEETCESQGFQSGTLACNPATCTLSTFSCEQ